MGKRWLPPMAVVMVFGMLMCFFDTPVFLVAGGSLSGIIPLYLAKHGCHARARILMGLCVLAFLMGALRMRACQMLCWQMEEFADANEYAELTGRLYKKEMKNDRILYYLRDCTAAQGEEGRMQKAGRVLVYTDRDDVEIGSILYLSGAIRRINDAQNEGGYDERSYLYGQMIFLKVTDSGHQVLKEPRWHVAESLYRLRLSMAERYADLLYDEEAGLLSTMVLGERAELTEDVKELFNDAGMSHMLAISGLHVSLFGMAIFSLLRHIRCPYVLSAGLSGLFVLLYGMLTGGGIPTLRAVGMFLVMLLSRVAGEQYDVLSALSLLAMLLLLAYPMAICSVSFLFSFGAVLGVVCVGQEASRTYLCICRLTWERKHRMTKGRRYRIRFGERVKAAVLTSCGIWLSTLPLVAYFFYAVPVYVIFLNLLLLPFMGTLLSMALLGGLGLPGARLFLMLCHYGLFYYEAMADTSLRLPFAKWIIGRPALWRVGLFYLCLYGFFFCLLGYRKRLMLHAKRNRRSGDKTASVRQCWLFGFLGVAVCCLLVLTVRPKAAFEMDVLSVGQGDGIFIESGDGAHFFIDGGSTSEEELGKNTLKPFFYAKGIDHIDLWFVTHMDLDHYSGLIQMLQADYPIGQVVFAESVERTESYDMLCALCKKKGVAISYMTKGDAIICKEGEDALRLRCVFPETPSAYQGTNENSLVLLLEKEGLACLLTGDIGSVQEQAILSSGVLEHICEKTVVLKSAHHGSNNSNCSEWLAALSPELVLISAGEHNRYGHPGKEAIARMDALGMEHLCTINCGQISVKWKDGEMVVEKYVK